MIERAAEPDAGMWSIPGGLVEVGEKAADAAIREAMEETSLTVEIVDRIGVVDKIVRDAEGGVKYHFIIIDFMAKPISGDVAPMDDALDAVWVTPDRFMRYNLTPTLIELLRDLGLYPGG